jgi:hypothetical protein
MYSIHFDLVFLVRVTAFKVELFDDVATWIQLWGNDAWR